MMAKMRIVTVGPSHGSLLLRTGAEGRAARLGHALTLRIADWECTTTFEGHIPTAVALRARMGSLEIVGAEGGVKALSDKDRRSILDNARKSLKTHIHREADFETTAVQQAGQGWSLLGDLVIAGVSKQVAVDVTVDGPATVTAQASVVQSDHGISPYSLMLGALAVRDRVEVRLEVVLPTE